MQAVTASWAMTKPMPWRGSPGSLAGHAPKIAGARRSVSSRKLGRTRSPCGAIV
jgi:hypothetical protein